MAKYLLSRVKRASKFKLLLIISVLAGIYFVNAYINKQAGKPTENEQAKHVDTKPKLQKGTPSYPTLAPQGVSIASLGGWTRVSPPDRNPVFAYVQALGDATISVSQQPIPENLQTNTDEGLSTLAKDFRANEMIMTGDTKVYIETKNNGAQSVLFIKKDLLVLIKASRNVPNDVWREYISSLE